ncbi:MAG: FAD-dependent oxidoreductase [Arenicellales bacterium WSBS_2016_MAG_OTU3]
MEPFTKNSTVVVGRGIIGLACAYALQRSRQTATIIDPDEISSRATTASAGIVGGSAVIPWATPGIWAGLPGMLGYPSSPLKISRI